MKRILFYSLLIFAVSFGSVHAQQKLDRFENTIESFEKEDAQNGYQPDAILFTGSSSIRKWTSLTEDMTPIPVINRGFGGSTIPEVLHYADRIILPHHPKIIVFYCGENDLANDNTKSNLALKSFKLFYEYVERNLPDTKVFFLAIKPSVSRWKYWDKFLDANKKLAKFMENKDNYFFVDTATPMLDNNGVVFQDIFVKDNLHMNPKGYAIWTGVLKPILEEYYKN